MKMQCPHCGVTGTADDSLRGRNVTCGKCGRNFIAGEEQLRFGEAEKIAVRCPSCGQQGKMDAALQGRDVTCPGCGTVFTAGEKATPPPSVPAAEPPPLPPRSTQRKEQAKESWQSPPPPLPEQFDTEQLLRTGVELDIPELITSTLRRAFRGGYFFRALAGSFLLSLISVIAQLVVGSICDVLGSLVGTGISVSLEMLISIGLGAILFGGLLWLALCHLRGRRPELEMVFQGMAKYCRWKLFATRVVGIVLILLGCGLLVVPGIYLFAGYYCSLLLVLDHGVGFWEALECSRKAIHKVFWKFSFALSIFYLPLLLVLLTMLRPLFTLWRGVTVYLQQHPEALDAGDGIDASVLQPLIEQLGGQMVLPILLYLFVSLLYLAVTPVFRAEVYERLFLSRNEMAEKKHTPGDSHGL